MPISITALTQDALDQKGIRDFSEMVRFTPGVSIDTSGTNAISIRGISSSGGAGTTGIYIDDTPIQMRALGFNPDDTLPKTFDLDRVNDATDAVTEKNANYANTVALRLAMLYQPADNVKITPSVMYQNKQQHDLST